MKLKYVLRFCILLHIGISYPGIAQQNNTGTAIAPYLIVIGLDGFSTTGLDKGKTPVIDSLIKNGSIIPRAHTVLPSVSSPNWASLIMGTGPEQHGVTSNEWEPDDYSLAPVVTDASGRFPTIFDLIVQQKKNPVVGAIYEWGGFGRLFNEKNVHFNQNPNGPDSTTWVATNFIKKQQPVFTFIHLDILDHAGHSYGHATPEYFKAVAKADSLTGIICNSIKEAGIANETVIMIVSDHGGIGTGHGGNTPEEVYVPMIISGKGVKKGYTVQQQVFAYDAAATMAYILNVKQPYVWTGRPILPAFEGYTEPENIWMGKQYTPAPIIYPEKKLYQQPGGLYINKATVEIVAETSGNIHYTTDGTEPSELSPIYTAPFNLYTTSIVKAKTLDKRNGTTNKTAIAYFRVFNKTPFSGLNVSYYYSGETWTQLPLFKQYTPITSAYADEFYIDTSVVKKILPKGKSSFGAVFEGYIQIDTTGEYSFYTQSDDGSRLFINNKLVVNNDGDHGVIEKSGKIHLEKGLLPVKIEFFNGGGGYWLEAYYKGPGIAKQIIPANLLFKSK